MQVSLATAIGTATEVNGQEQPIGSAKIESGSLVCDLTPHQLRAFALTLKAPARKLAPPVSQPIVLTYNADVISAKGEKGDGQFGVMGASFPAEMVPDSIVSGGVLFTLGPKGLAKQNAVACQGQSLTIPRGTFNRIYFLAASSAQDAQVTLSVDGKPVTRTMEGWTGFVGQWDNRIWDGYVKKETDYTWDAILYEGLTPGYVRKRECRMAHDAPSPRQR